MVQPCPELTRNPVKVLGVPIDPVSLEQAILKVASMAQQQDASLVVTADASCLVLTHEDEEFASIVRSAELVTADGAGVVWALKRKGIILTEKVSGVVLAEHLVARSEELGLKIYFLGAAPGIADAAATRMTAKYPGCQIVGSRDGFFPQEKASELCRQVVESGANVLLVAMGMPKQEKFLKAHRNELPGIVGIGVGGTLDVLSGTVKRAPVLWQKLQLEWLWRALSNRKNFAKLKRLPKFVSMVKKEPK